MAYYAKCLGADHDLYGDWAEFCLAKPFLNKDTKNG